MPAPRRRAFTLVELLVVISIVAVLIALLLPVLSGARRKATQVACLSNLRQFGAALFAYAGENRGWFPAAASGRNVYPEDWVHWQHGRDANVSSILPFLGRDTGVLVCPLGLAERPLEPYQLSNGPYRYSYSVNVHFTGWGGGTFGSGWAIQPCRLGKAVNPSRKILAVEEDSEVH